MGDLLDPPLKLQQVLCYTLAYFAIHPMAFKIELALEKSLISLPVKSVIHFIWPPVPAAGP